MSEQEARGKRHRGPLRAVLASGVVVVVLLAVLSLPALGPALAQDLTTVSYGEIPAISNIGLYAGLEKGYFREEGLDVRMHQFASGAKMIAPLAAGEIGVAGGGSSAALFNSIASGMDFWIVADKGQVRPGFGGGDLLVVRKDLLPVFQREGLRALKGRTVGMYAKGSINDYGLARMLESVGLSLADVKDVYIAPPNHPQAFLTKAIDAGVEAEPWGTRAESAGAGVKFLRAYEVDSLRTVQIAVIMYAGRFIREQPKAARGFMKAYVRGIRYNHAQGYKHPEMLAVLSKYTKVPPQVIAGSELFYLDGDARPNVESLADQQEWFLKQGFAKQRVPMDRVLNLSFLEGAKP